MSWKMRYAAAALALTLAATACGRPAPDTSPGESPGAVAPTAGLKATTEPGTKPVPKVVWAVYREVNSLDPAYAFDYPENTAISLMCESLLRQAPDGSVGPGLATLSTPSPTEFVFTLRPEARFWNGDPVTAADVVYSLERQRDPAVAGFYGQVFTRVDSIQATGDREVTVTLKKPDYWLQGELASIPGVVIQKEYAEKQGKKYGTPSGGVMCTGAYEFSSWSPGVGVTAKASKDYWQDGVQPKVEEMVIKGVSDDTALTAGLQTGAIDGTFALALSTLDQLKASDNVAVHRGPGWLTDAAIVSADSGPLANQKVRQALSLAIDRQAIIDEVHKGAALMPKWLANPGVFGYGKETFDAAYNKAPVLGHDVAKAKKLVEEAGVAGKTVTFGTSSQIANISAVSGVYKAAAEEIGLKVKLKSVSAQNYINFFTDPAARKGVDAFFTQNYGDYAGPEALMSTIVLPEGSQNYNGYDDKELISLLEKARSTADPKKRADLMVEAEKIFTEQMIWIPNVQPIQLTIMDKNLTGTVGSFAYMFAPWANQLGGKG